MTTYFVSGHLDLSLQEFEKHYVPKLTESVEQKDAFVVGDARGCDHMTQQFLRSKLFSTLQGLKRVRVYHMLERPRFNDGFSNMGGFKSDAERDLAMTLASYKDIAWVRKGREKSGTAKNIARRAKVGTPDGVTVKVQRLGTKGKILEESDAPLMNIESGMAFLCEERAAYCLGKDKCGGFWCCDPSSRIRLTPESLARCQTLMGVFAEKK